MVKNLLFEKSGNGIVEKMGANYIRSHPDFLERLNHGDKVVCFEMEHFKKNISEIGDSTKSVLSVLLDVLEEIIIVENEEELKELQKRAKKMHLRLNR